MCIVYHTIGLSFSVTLYVYIHLFILSRYILNLRNFALHNMDTSSYLACNMFYNHVTMCTRVVQNTILTGI